ncbi:Plexin Domain-Containing Protein 1 [Manis pentadactyla]|nr:Plexin Domain-Containing Protein 1 [Manis pentadactyla]
MPDASGYVERTETLALRKELGSGSDVTGVQDVGTGLWETMRLWFQDYSDARVISKVMVEFQETGDVWLTLMLKLKCRILTPGLGLELVKLALRKELGSGSDVTGSARCWNRVMVKCEILTKGLGLALVHYGKI